MSDLREALEKLAAELEYDVAGAPGKIRAVLAAYPAEPVPGAAVEAAAKVLRDEGGQPGSSLHSWRCEFPDGRFGECDCVEVTARLMLEAAAPLLLNESPR